jgi:hypothetical protein
MKVDPWINIPWGSKYRGERNEMPLINKIFDDNTIYSAMES